MQCTRQQLMVIGMLASLSTAIVGQEVNPALDVSQQFEAIRVKIRRVAETMNQKRDELRGADETTIKQFHAEIQNLSTELRDLFSEAEKLCAAIRERSDPSDTAEYQSAMEAYTKTTQEYIAALKQYGAALETYRDAGRELSRSNTGARDDPARARRQATETMTE
jgi:uncharacterized protein YukE